MIKSFTNYQGITYDLTLDAVRDNLATKDKEYAQKAKEMTESSNISTFFSLKHITNGVIDYAQYFTIPVNPTDIESINRTFSYNHIIGILYKENFIPEFTYPKSMTGYEYEYECADILRKKGFINVEVTKGSGDQGIDVIAIKNNKRYGIQCKYYDNPVPNKAVQEAHAGAAHHGCDVAVVMTNSTFTKSAIELAHSIGVKLWSSHYDYKEV